jgi:hypothetical protein
MVAREQYAKGNSFPAVALCAAATELERLIVELAMIELALYTGNSAEAQRLLAEIYA